MKFIPRIVLSFCLWFCLTVSLKAQQTEPALQVILDQGKVRFTARQPEWQVHLAVTNQRGETLYDSGHNHFGALEWNLTDREGQPLTGGLYRYTLTLQDSSGATVRRHQGSFILEQDAQHLWITAQDETALGADILGGALTATRAAGRTLAGRDPADQARRSVDGRKLVTGDGETKPSETGVRLAPNVGGSGTSGRIAKWIDNSGNLGDSLISESAGTVTLNGKLSGVYGVNAPAFDRAFFFQTMASGAGSGFYVNNDTWLNSTKDFSTPLAINFESVIRHGAAGGTGAGVITDAVNFAIDNATFNGALITNSYGLKIGTLAGTNKWGIYDASGGNWYASGNVGIGTTAPAHRLHVVNSSGNAIYGETAGSFAAGVKGNSTVAGSYGVWGTTTATNGYGVYGFAQGANGYGVFGQATGAGYGVVGTNTDLVNGTAGQFNGHVNVSNTLAVATNGLLRVDSIRPNVGSSVVTLTGNLDVVGNVSKTAGSFKIDHPLDPANKYLYHSFVESPDMMNIYNGNVTTDQLGLAVITLPDYFETLNREFRYQLTVIGKFAQAIVSEEINGNQFRIETNQPYVKVSWQVTGVRQDAYAEAHRIPTEELKSETERGSYLHPEVHGQPEEKGIEWVRQPEMMKRLKEQREKAEKEKKSN